LPGPNREAKRFTNLWLAKNITRIEESVRDIPRRMYRLGKPRVDRSRDEWCEQLRNMFALTPNALAMLMKSEERT